MTEEHQSIWNAIHQWCDEQHCEIPDQNRRALMDRILALRTKGDQHTNHLGPNDEKPLLCASLHERLISTLARKEKEYSEVCHWFETEYDSSVSAETVADWEKTGIEINAQIKILRFLLSDDVE